MTRTYESRTVAVWPVVLLVAFAAGARADGFASDWQRLHDRIWIGPTMWANPMEDWKIQEGRAICTSRGGDRNLHSITHQLSDAATEFTLTTRCRLQQRGEHTGVGFRVGIHDEINDHRGNCVWGEGIDAGIVNDKLIVGERSAPLPKGVDFDDINLRLQCSVFDGQCVLALELLSGENDQKLATLSSDAIAPGDLIGNVAVVSNLGLPANKNTGSLWEFSEFRGSGPKLVGHPEQAFGPILWAMHSLSDSRSDEGYVLKLTAFIPPFGADESNQVAIEYETSEGQKSRIATIDPDSRTATFRIANWDQSRDHAYRLTYEQRFTEGTSDTVEYNGTIRKEPIGRPLVLGALTCQHHSGFPYAPVAKNLQAVNPDMLFFSGDQLYEENGGYGIIRRPADRAILNYLRKFYMFGWAFRDTMRDRPTICIPDDHDVFHGNIWGEGGEGNQSLTSGYVQPVKMVQVVHRTTCSHHPDFFDPTPAGNGISVYFGDMVFGRVSFAILGDRQFKSSPERVSAGKGRPDHVQDKDFDVSTIDTEGLELLGERQEKFLEAWVRDWRGADMKVLLSETVFANVATHHGGYDAYLRADLDSSGWPQTARNRALRIIRKAMPLHVNGDQHLATLIQYGIDKPRDGSWSFCTPAISVGYPRWWRPEEVGQIVTGVPAHGLPNTGLFKDGFDHPTYVFAVGNPPGGQSNSRYETAHNKGSGFGVVRIDTEKRTYNCECYKFLCDASRGPTNDNQMPGWPYSISQRDNDGRTVAGQLQAIDLDGLEHPVVSVIEAETGEFIYSFPPTETSFRPWVYSAGRYRVEISSDNQPVRTIEAALRQ